jgi:putative peptidoglycan lipid II flippase
VRQDSLKATAVVMAGLGASVATGFLRQTAIAYALGAGRGADIFLVAFAIPEFVFIALPIVLVPAFLPPFIETRTQAGEAGAWRFGAAVTLELAGFLVLLTIVAGLGAPRYLRWLAPGFTPVELAAALAATRLMLPALGLMGLAYLASSALQAYRRFAAPSLLTAIYNVVFILALFAGPLGWPAGRASWGVTLGAAAALVLQWALLWRRRPPDAWQAITRRAAALPVRSWLVAQLALPLAAGYAVHHLILLIDRAFATGLGAGSVAALNYADHLAAVVAQLSGLAIATVVFPELAEQLGRGNVVQARRSLAAAMSLVWIIALPATVALVLLSRPVVQILFEHGAFDRAATAAVSGPLLWYPVATLADALCQPLWRVIYAQRRAGTVLAVNGLQTGIRIAANFVLVVQFGYIGLAISAALGLTVQLFVLGWLVRRSLGNFVSGELRERGLRTIFVTAVTVLPAALLAQRLSGAHALPALLICGAGFVVFAVIQLPKVLRGSYVGSTTSGYTGEK